MIKCCGSSRPEINIKLSITFMEITSCCLGPNNAIELRIRNSFGNSKLEENSGKIFWVKTISRKLLRKFQLFQTFSQSRGSWILRPQTPLANLHFQITRWNFHSKVLRFKCSSSRISTRDSTIAKLWIIFYAEFLFTNTEFNSEANCWVLRFFRSERNDSVMKQR